MPIFESHSMKNRETRIESIVSNEGLKGRVCNRMGCGRQILSPDGMPAYNRHFCDAACRRADKRERMQQKRHKARIGRCGHCGRKLDQRPVPDGSVPRHKALPESGTPQTMSQVQIDEAASPRITTSRSLNAEERILTTAIVGG